jgi:hypothetical protein
MLWLGPDNWGGILLVEEIEIEEDEEEGVEEDERGQEGEREGGGEGGGEEGMGVQSVYDIEEDGTERERNNTQNQIEDDFSRNSFTENPSKSSKITTKSPIKNGKSNSKNSGNEKNSVKFDEFAFLDHLLDDKKDKKAKKGISSTSYSKRNEGGNSEDEDEDEGEGDGDYYYGDGEEDGEEGGEGEGQRQGQGQGGGREEEEEEERPYSIEEKKNQLLQVRAMVTVFPSSNIFSFLHIQMISSVQQTHMYVHPTIIRNVRYHFLRTLLRLTGRSLPIYLLPLPNILNSLLVRTVQTS